MYYQAPDQSIRHLDSADYEYLLPVGSVPITDAQAEALRPKPDPKDAIRAEIAKLEASLTPRRLREALLSGEHDAIAAIDQQIAKLREQL